MKYFIMLAICFCSLSSKAQTDEPAPPYQRFAGLPPIQLLLGDSTSKYTKVDIPSKKPVLVMLFSPDCNHCQHTAEEMLAQKEKLENIHIVMATMYSLQQMNDFADKYRLRQMPNVVIGKDMYFLLPPFFNVKNLPFMAFYDKKGNLISVFEGSMPIAKVIELFEKNK